MEKETNCKKIKIAFIAEDFPPNKGGVAEYSINVAKSIDSRGCEIKIIAPRVTGDKEFDEMHEFSIQRIGRINIRRKDLGLLPRYKAVKSFQSSLNHWYKKEFKNYKPDFAIVSSVSEWATMLWNENVPYAVCVHGGDAFGSRADFIRTLYRRWIVKRIFKKSAVIFANSEYTARKVRDIEKELGKKTIVQYCGVAPEFIKAAEKKRCSYNSSKNGHHLLTMCRLEPIKACDIVLKAVAILTAKYPDIKLTIAGDGSLRGELELLSKKLGIGAKVTFIGYIESIQKKIELFYNSDIYVQSGRNNPKDKRFEAFGIVFAEAGICGKPVIGPNYGGVKEIIIQNKTGLLVRPNDEYDFADAVNQLLMNPKKAEGMGESARKWVSSRFQYDIIANNIISYMLENQNPNKCVDIQ